VCDSLPPSPWGLECIQTAKYDSGHGLMSSATVRDSTRRDSDAAGTVAGVADEPAQATVYDVSCPHCRKAFRQELLSGSAARYHGFKCPHCRLFVPLERVSEKPAKPTAGR
jgi:hypothetical protein